MLCQAVLTGFEVIMTTPRHISRMRVLFASIAWVALVGFALVTARITIAGIPGPYDEGAVGCGTLFEKYWRHDAMCKERMINYLQFEAAASTLAVVASLAWLWARRRDEAKPLW
jgi:hypothetical protein